MFTLVPMVFVTVMSFLAALYQLWDLFASGQYMLAGLDLVIVIASIFVLLESAVRVHAGRGGLPTRLTTAADSAPAG